MDYVPVPYVKLGEILLEQMGETAYTRQPRVQIDAGEFYQQNEKIVHPPQVIDFQIDLFELWESTKIPWKTMMMTFSRAFFFSMPFHPSQIFDSIVNFNVSANVGPQHGMVPVIEVLHMHQKIYQIQNTEYFGYFNDPPPQAPRPGIGRELGIHRPDGLLRFPIDSALSSSSNSVLDFFKITHVIVNGWRMYDDLAVFRSRPR